MDRDPGACPARPRLPIPSLLLPKPGMLSMPHIVSSCGPGLRIKRRVKAVEFLTPSKGRGRAGQGAAECRFHRGRENSLPLRATLTLYLGGSRESSVQFRLCPPRGPLGRPVDQRCRGKGEPHHRGPASSLKALTGCPLGKETHSVSLPGHQSLQEQAQLFLAIMCHAWLWPPAPESSVTHRPLPSVPRGLGRVALAWGWYV